MAKRKFSDPSSVRILKSACGDEGYALLRPKMDIAMLLTFLERFDHLGWFPPIDDEKRLLLAANDVIMHVVRPTLCFYEFCSKGGRGERNPWLTLFFHVDANAQVRVCGVETTDFVRRHRSRVNKLLRHRILLLDDWLRQAVKDES